MPSSTYLSIKDAAQRYRCAEITMRRFVRSVLAHENSKDRAFIRPTVREAARLRRRNRALSYSIATDLLERHFGRSAEQSHAAPEPPRGEDIFSLLERVNTSLQEQLGVKDEQIRQLAKAIDGLSERQRETNILMRGLQERLLLAAPKEDVVEASVARPPKSVRRTRRWWGVWGR